MKKDLYKKIFEPSDCLPESLITGYIDGTLDEQQMHHVEEHLVDCELCTEAMEGLLLVKNKSVLKNISSDVKNLVSKNNKQRRFVSSGVWLAAAASVAIIIATIFTLNYLNSNQDQIALNEVKLPETDSLKNKLKQEVEVQQTRDANEEKITEQKEIISPLANALPPSIKKSDAFNAEERNSITIVDQEAEVAEETASVASDDQLKNSENENLKPEVAFNNVQVAAPENYGNAGSNSEERAQSRMTTTTKSEKLKTTPAKESIVFLNDLKIIDYSETITPAFAPEPLSKHTEARYATPEEKQQEANINSGKPDYKEIISPALIAYQKKQYTNAALLFEEMIKNNPADLNARFYSGMSYFYLNQNQKAKDQFNFLLNSVHTFTEETKYYAALNLIILNEHEKAKLLLIEVINMNNFYKERAQQKLDEIK